MTGKIGKWCRRRGLSPSQNYAQKSAFSSLTSFRIARYCTPSVGWRFFAVGGKMGIFRPFMGKKWGSFLNANEPSRGPGV